MNGEKTNYYSYSASENNEIKKIREKYEAPVTADTKIERLRKLDGSVYNTASTVSIAIGIIGTLIFGFGLTCILTWGETLFTAGIIFGLIGMVIVLAAYPIFKRVFEKKKKEITPEILKLTDELLK